MIAITELVYGLRFVFMLLAVVCLGWMLLALWHSTHVDPPRRREDQELASWLSLIHI